MKQNNRDAVIVAYGRSPLARAYKGSFAQTHPVEFAAQTLSGVLDRLPGLDRSAIDDVIVGCAMPERYTGFNVARLIAQHADLPDQVPGQTVNRFCSSGLQAIATAANAIKAGEIDVAVAGGVELMTGIQMTHSEEYQYAPLSAKQPGTYLPMGITAERVAERYHVSREDMEQMAVESHQKAAQAQENGWFDGEVVPVTIETEADPATVTRDEGIRPNTTAEKLAELKPCFQEDGVVTAATSSQMTDGAAFVVIMSRERAGQLGFAPLASVLSFAVAGVPADIMGIGPVAAIPKVLARSGLTADDMDVIELNEAFAAQALACIRELGLPAEKVNPNGGAMALGHPLGATGAVLVCKALSELERKKGTYGMISMCIGGGMGAAAILARESI